MRTWMTSVLVCAMLLGGTAAWAQGGPPPPPGHPPGFSGGPPGPSQGPRESPRTRWTDSERAEMRELIDTVMFVKLTRKVNLSDEQMALMARKFEDFQKKRREWRDEQRSLNDALRDALDKDADEGTVRARLDALVAHEAKFQTLQAAFFQEAFQGLTVAQQAKFYMFMADFEEEMRDLFRQARERGRSEMEQNLRTEQEKLRRGQENLRKELEELRKERAAPQAPGGNLPGK